MYRLLDVIVPDYEPIIIPGNDTAEAALIQPGMIGFIVIVALFLVVTAFVMIRQMKRKGDSLE